MANHRAEIIREFTKDSTRVPALAADFFAVDALPGRALFIDGGNAKVLQSDICQISLIKVCALTYDDTLKEKIIEEYHAIVRKEGNTITLKTHPASEEYVITAVNSDEELSEGTRLLRRLLELRLARMRAEQEHDCLIVLDGSFDTKTEAEKHSLSRLHEVCAQRHIVLAGLSKTSTLSSKGRMITRQLSLLRPGERGYFTTERHTFARLHPHSTYVFRLDVAHTHRDKTAGILAHYAKDPLFRGYPYPLILADKSAKIPARDVDREKALLAAVSGVDWKYVLHELACCDAHDVIDRINKFA